MAKEKTQEKPAKKEEKKGMTNARAFIAVGTQGAKDRKELCAKMIALVGDKNGKDSNGTCLNSKGKPIREERIMQQISAMIRDINQNRGVKSGGWWSKYTVEESDNEIKLVAKA